MHVDKLRTNIAFNGSIIDTHMHIGHWSKNGNSNNTLNFDSNTIDEFVKNPLNVQVSGAVQQDEVEKVIISNLDGLVVNGQDETTANKALLEMCNSNPKYHALAACAPSVTEGNSVYINNLIQENPDKFIGLKFHPRHFNAQADSDIYRPYMFLAERYNLPCMFHSDLQFAPDGKPVDKISSPEAIHNIARLHPDVPVIMAHMGAGDAKSHQNAIEELLKSIDNKDSKLYVDISWVDWGKDGLSSNQKPSIVKLIKELQKRNALDGILFGTDAPLGCFGETPAGGLSPRQAYEKTVGDLKTVIKENFKEQSDDLINKIFYQNAENLFFKKDWTTPVEPKIPKTPLIKIIGMVAAVLALIGLGGVVIDKISEAKDTGLNK